MWNLKIIQTSLFTKQKQNHRHKTISSLSQGAMEGQSQGIALTDTN